ncbi:MAG: phosphoglycerate kinase [Fidelibacterota bacterium]
MTKIRTLKSLSLMNQRVLIRVDFNVPVESGKVTDDFRVRSALPTIRACLKNGASVVLMSHLGRPGGRRVENLSLVRVGEVVCDLLEKPAKFSGDCVSEEAIDVSGSLSPGEIHLLENLRFHPGETANDPAFSVLLARHGTVYVNDAFGTAHRAHASNVGVASHFRERGMGLLMEKEHRFLSGSLKNPRRPLTIVVGGAKVGTKLALMSRFLQDADSILVGGAMAFTFLKSQGLSVGRSLVEDDSLEAAGRILSIARERKVSFHLPVDVVVTRDVASGRPGGERDVDDLEQDLQGVDIGSKTVQSFRQVIEESKTVVWNGPMGVFEMSSFQRGTVAVARSIARIARSGGTAVVGGGDTAAAVRRLGLDGQMTHISTGGGASLELLAGKSLPAFEALRTDD